MQKVLNNAGVKVFTSGVNLAKKISLSTLGIVVLAVVSSTPASSKMVLPKFEDLPQLSPEVQHATSCSRIANFFTRAHYKVVDINDDFADKVIDQYLSYLDYGRSLLTRAEADSLYQNREQILRAIKYCDLSYPFALYNAALRKRFVKYSYFLEAMKHTPDVKSDLSLMRDRTKAPFIENEELLKKQWDAEVINEYDNQILNGKTDEEARQKIIRRYTAALSKLAQTKSEDAFSTFENSFATAIDPHTNYFSPQDTENFNDDMNLSLEGIGAVLTSEDEYTSINEIIPGSPAEHTKKLKAKDRIVGVRQEDGSYDDITGWRLNDVVKKIKGPKGTRVTLDIERGDGANAKTFSVEIVRDKIRLQDREAKGEVKTAYDGTSVGVISVKSFYTDLHKDIAREIEKLKKAQVRSIIIDLRSDGGGLLPEAVDSSGLFIKSGPVVVVRDAVGNELVQSDTDDSIAYDGPLVVLINRLSASSSEIMAAALRDYGRALIVGDTSFGKGTVQQSRPLERIYDMSAVPLGSIHYTIGKFYRINGGSTQLEGVKPDIVLPGLVDDEEYGERTEKNALPWDSIKSVDYKPYLNIDAYVEPLNLKHEERVKNDPVFKIMADELARYRSLKKEQYLTVNLEKREELKARDDAFRLNAANIRLKAMGKPLLENIKDLPEDFEFEDVLLKETVNIASDLATAQSERLVKSADSSVLRRFAPPKTVPQAN